MYPCRPPPIPSYAYRKSLSTPRRRSASLDDFRALRERDQTGLGSAEGYPSDHAVCTDEEYEVFRAAGAIDEDPVEGAEDILIVERIKEMLLDR